MKTLFLIRHAKSSWADPSLTDKKRPLNKRGRRDAPFMAKLMIEKKIKADLILSSPAVRALTTAQHFAQAQGIPLSKIDVRDLIYASFVNDLVRMVQGLDDAHSIVFLFGHNPEFTSFANRFSDQYIDNVPTCGIVGIQGEIDSWSQFDRNTCQLIGFDYPKRYFPK
ncbi:MAG: histidine phosphatase family protein [Bacteroidota bacterium]